jgi:hypothetical protein
VIVEFEEAFTLPEGPARTAAIAAWVQGLFRGGDRVPVLVGGAAVELLTGGAYTTGDLDFVGFVPASVRRRLEAKGFERSGRHFIHESAQIFLEFPSDALAPDETAVRREMFGHQVVLVSVEDLLVDRLGAWEYWRSGIDGANALQLYRSCRKEIDEGRLNRRASESGFESALNALRRFVERWPDRDPDADTLALWANNGPQPEAP